LLKYTRDNVGKPFGSHHEVSTWKGGTGLSNQPPKTEYIA